LEEKLTFLIFIGTLSLVLGVFVLSWERQKTGKLSDVTYPLLAAMLFGMAGVTRKMGLSIANFPVLGASIGAITSLIVYIPYFTFLRGEISLKRDALWLLFIGGLFGSMARIFIFYSYSLGEVVRVEPLINSTPAFTVAFALIFLKKEERITLRIITGAFLIIMGVILVVTS